MRLWQANTGISLRILRSDPRDQRLDITGLTAVTTARRAALLALGALEHSTAGELPHQVAEHQRRNSARRVLFSMWRRRDAATLGGVESAGRCEGAGAGAERSPSWHL